jgi:hypothetical protein
MGEKMKEEKNFGECDFEECPHWKYDEKTNGFCTYHPEKCYIDEKNKLREV